MCNFSICVICFKNILQTVVYQTYFKKHLYLRWTMATQISNGYHSTNLSYNYDMKGWLEGPWGMNISHHLKKEEQIETLSFQLHVKPVQTCLCCMTVSYFSTIVCLHPGRLCHIFETVPWQLYNAITCFGYRSYTRWLSCVCSTAQFTCQHPGCWAGRR